jgi:hypothetical protein
MLERRNLGLIDPKDCGSLALRQPPPLDVGDDLCCQLGFRQQVISMWKAQVSEHVTGTRRKFSRFGIFPLLISSPACALIEAVDGSDPIPSPPVFARSVSRATIARD